MKTEIAQRIKAMLPPSFVMPLQARNNVRSEQIFLFAGTFSPVRIQNTYCVILSLIRDSPAHHVGHLEKRTDIVSPMLLSESIIFVIPQQHRVN